MPDGTGKVTCNYIEGPRHAADERREAHQGEGAGAPRPAACPGPAANSDLGAGCTGVVFSCGTASTIPGRGSECPCGRGPSLHRRGLLRLGRGMRRGEVWTVAGGKDYAGKPQPVVIVQEDVQFLSAMQKSRIHEVHGHLGL